MAVSLGVIKQMKMLIIGDSYATTYSELGWGSLIKNHLKCHVDNRSLPGTGIIYSYNQLTNALKYNDYDVVIVVITSADRPYHRNILIHGGFPKYNDGTPVSDEIKQAIKSYYLHLYDNENSQITNSMFCRSLAQISLERPNTKFIFLPAFDQFEKLEKGNYVVTGPRLLHYSMLDKESHDAEVRGELVEKLNHLTFLQNETLTNYIIEFINNYKFGCMTHKTLERLEVLK